MSSVCRRVEDVAGTLGVSSAVLLATCRELGLGVASPKSMLNETEVTALKAQLRKRRRNRSVQARQGMNRRGNAASNRAQLKAWDSLVQHRRAGTAVQGVVTAVVKGGLLVDVGVQGFMPASQVDSDWIDDLHTFVGKRVSAKIIDLDSARRSVVLSRREIVDQGRQQRASKLLNELVAGEEIDSVVLRRTDRGVVVRVDDALEVWVPENEVPSELQRVSIGDCVPITVCDISDARVIGSFRLASMLGKKTDHSTDEVGSIASSSGGLLRIRDGVLTVDVASEELLTERLAKAVELARDGGVGVLFVASEPGVKRAVRQLVKDGEVPGVDARRSRQALGGLELALNQEM